jgi:hypothetical protein
VVLVVALVAEKLLEDLVEPQKAKPVHRQLKTNQ